MGPDVETKQQTTAPPVIKQREISFIMIKPDGVERGLMGRTVRKLEEKGNQLVAMLWRGKGVVRVGRTLLGETNPASSACGTIRGDGCIEVGRNLCHASDSAESGLKEAALWFPDESLDNPVEMLSEVFVYE